MINLDNINEMYYEKKISKGYKTKSWTNSSGVYVECKIRRDPRRICAPVPELKEEQRRILREELVSFPAHKRAFGFVKGRTILDNAKQHLSQEDIGILSIDLKDFFNTITIEQVMDALLKHKMDTEKAEYISRVCTRYGVLPQGAPTSPALSNIVARPMDKQLCKLCKKHNLRYTRYADDITISGDSLILHEILNSVISIVNRYGWKINQTKVDILLKSESQNVTGITVNSKPSPPSKNVKRLRGWLHNIERDVRAGEMKTFKELEARYQSWASLHGYANFLYQIDKKYKCYVDQAQEIRKLLVESERNIS